MKLDFIFESDHFMTPDELYCAQIRVTIVKHKDAISTPLGTCNVWNWDFVSFYDEDNRIQRRFSDFPEKEQERMLREAERLAEAHSFDYAI